MPSGLTLAFPIDRHERCRADRGPLVSARQSTANELDDLNGEHYESICLSLS